MSNNPTLSVWVTDRSAFRSGVSPPSWFPGRYFLLFRPLSRAGSSSPKPLHVGETQASAILGPLPLSVFILFSKEPKSVLWL